MQGTLWLLFLAAPTQFTQGSHLPASYIKDTIQKAQELSQQKSTLQPHGHISPVEVSSSSSTPIPLETDTKTIPALSNDDNYEDDEYQTTTVLRGQDSPETVQPSSSSASPILSSSPTHKVIKQDDEVSTFRSLTSPSIFTESGEEVVDGLGRGPSDLPNRTRRPSSPFSGAGEKTVDENQGSLSQDGKRYHGKSLNYWLKFVTIKISMIMMIGFSSRSHMRRKAHEALCLFRIHFQRKNLRVWVS
jgi:hypothetical protein